MKSTDRLRRLLSEPRDDHELAPLQQRIHAETLRGSDAMRAANFLAIDTHDLDRLFALYDEHFFASAMSAAVGQIPLAFRLSKRMTSNAGRTATRFPPGDDDHRHLAYEITISTHLLFESFHEGDRDITVNGLVCSDRLEALQRVFEHELVHLAEQLVWRSSSCRRPRFRDLAGGLFGHQAFTHALITPRERAVVQHGLQVGARVWFIHEGRRHEGTLNRVTKRATVLVPDATGRRHSDGLSYRKFYVPLSMLRPVEGSPRPERRDPADQPGA